MRHPGSVLGRAGLLVALLAWSSGGVRGQAPAPIARSAPGGFQILDAAAPAGAAPLLRDVRFLPIRLSTPVESFSPRTDIPREETFEAGARIRLPDGSRLYRVATQETTALLQVTAAGARVVGRYRGNGGASGILATVAASAFGPWLAFSVAPAGGGAAGVVLARTDGSSVASPLMVPPAGAVPSSVAFAAGALFLTSACGTLVRVDTATFGSAAIPLPVPAGFIDDAIRVSDDGSAIALRAGISEAACVVLRVPAAGGPVVAFGAPGPVRGPNYGAPGVRPRLSLTADGSLVSFFEGSGSEFNLLVGEAFGLQFTVPLNPGIGLALGIESEIVIGDGNNVLTFFANRPPAGRILVTIPYVILQLLLGFAGNVPIHLFNSLDGLFPSSAMPFMELDGHCQAGPGGPRFFLMGPAGAPRKLIRVEPGVTGGSAPIDGLESVEEAALLGTGLLAVRGRLSGASDPSGWLVPVTGGAALPFTAFSPLPPRRVASDPGASRLAVVFGSAGADQLWTWSAASPAAPVLVETAPQIGDDLEWTPDGRLIYRAGGGAIRRWHPEGFVESVASFSSPVINL